MKELDVVLTALHNAGINEAVSIENKILMVINYGSGFIHYVVDPYLYWDTVDERSYLLTVWDIPTLKENRNRPLAKYLTLDEIITFYMERKKDLT